MTVDCETTQAPARAHLEEALERHRPELQRYCRRLLGSAYEAEEAVQDTLVRGWKHIHRFEGRSSLRTWLFQIATNVCRDTMLRRSRRPVPVDLGPEVHAGNVGHEMDRSREPDPVDRAITRDEVRAALAVLFERLPARQRAVLILRDVLRWKSAEVADLFGISVEAVNSLLQRGRTTLANGRASGGETDFRSRRVGPLARYVEAFERYDVDAFVRVVVTDVENA